MKAIFFNGPKQVGKDTAVRLLTAYKQERSKTGKRSLFDAYRFKHYKAADPLKMATHAMYGRVFEEWQKEIPQEDLFGLTPREAYIAMSENHMKPLHGDDVFGRILARRLVAGGDRRQIAMISDCRFAPEVERVAEALGTENCLLLRVRRQDRGYEGDTGSYLEVPDVETYDIYNDSTKNKLLNELVSVIDRWLVQLSKRVNQ